MGKYPPTPPGFRWAIIIMRVSSAITLVTALYLGTPQLGGEETLHAVRFIAGALAFVAATWVSPYSTAFLVLIGFALVVTPIGTGSSAIFVAIPALILAWLLYARRRAVKIDPDAVSRAEDDAVMRHAIRNVEDLKSLGWEQVGALSVRIRLSTIVASILLHPDRTSCAEVTDIVVAITSQFPGERKLVTRNSGGAPLPPSSLTNDHRGAKPLALAIAHDEALRLLEANGFTPIQFDRDEVTDFVIAAERSHIEFMSETGNRFQGNLKGSGPIDSSDASAQRIREWRMAEAPTD